MTAAPSPVPPSPSPSAIALRAGKHVTLGAERKLRLDCGVELGPFTLAYQTYGTLNADKSNAVLICHALTLDQLVIETHPVTGKPGWWDTFVAPGKPLDPAKYCIICFNVVGGCMGSVGPTEIDPATGKPYGLNFPVVTIEERAGMGQRDQDGS